VEIPPVLKIARVANTDALARQFKRRVLANIERAAVLAAVKS
jgi:hypothetical protein